MTTRRPIGPIGRSVLLFLEMLWVVAVSFLVTTVVCLAWSPNGSHELPWWPTYRICALGTFVIYAGIRINNWLNKPL